MLYLITTFAIFIEICKQKFVRKSKNTGIKPNSLTATDKRIPEPRSLSLNGIPIIVSFVLGNRPNKK